MRVVRARVVVKGGEGLGRRNERRNAETYD
jgi:hypothetical protein